MKRHLGLVVLLLIIATGLRTWHLTTQSIWFDEGFSWHAASQPTLSAAMNGDPTNPPLYYLLLHGWIRLIGDSEFGLRSMSLLQGIVLLAFSTTLARRWFNTNAALIALAIGSFTPLLWWASQEARMYNLLALAVLSMAAGLMAFVRHNTPTRRAWLLLILGELGALYTHNTGIVVLGAANLVFAIAWIAQNIRPQRDWPALMRWTGSQLIILLLWLPEILARFRNLSTANAALRTSPGVSLQLLWQSWEAIWASSWEMVLDNPSQLRAASAILILLLIAGLFAMRRKEGRLLWGMTASLYVVMLAALTVLGVNLHGRYLIMLTPLLVIGLGAGLTLIPLPPQARRVAQIAAIIAIAATWIVLPGQPEVRYQHDQARDIVNYYAETLGPNDVILTWSYAERYELHYYANRIDLSPRLITLPEGADRATIAPLLDEALGSSFPLRAEINTWYTQASDRRGMLPCLLGHNNAPPLESYTVQGMTTTGYRIAQPINAPEPSEAHANLGTASLDALGLPQTTVLAEHGICLPVEVIVQSPHAESLGAAINIVNDLNWELAGADAPLLTASQAPSNSLNPGTIIAAFPLLYLPPGTPAGEYPVMVRVYGEDHPDGLDVLEPTSGAPTGKDIAAGHVRAAHNADAVFDGDCTLPIGEALALTNCAAITEKEVASAGETLRLTFAWQVKTTPLPIEITLAGSDWRVTTTTTLQEQGAVLDWHALTIPADAEGDATLTVRTSANEAVRLTEYTIEATDHVLTPPPVTVTSGIKFVDAGAIYGMEAALDTVVSGEAFQVTLVWAAEAATPTSYNVTVQLLDGEGVLLAQHDGVPSSGTRPTTGWLAGEYITDQHVLEFREEVGEYTGPAQLIVALYDPQNGTRLLTESGADSVTLVSELTVISPQ